MRTKLSHRRVFPQLLGALPKFFIVFIYFIYVFVQIFHKHAEHIATLVQFDNKCTRRKRGEEISGLQGYFLAACIGIL